jgi:hypothetical protein
MGEDEAKFLKSMSNKRTENRALELLLADRRFQRVDLATKLRIIDALPVQGEWGVQTFDAVMTTTPIDAITLSNVDAVLPTLHLVEMKSTRKPIKDANLNGFFFGATEREYAMAAALGDRYVFAFIVLNSANDFGRPFAVLLTLDQVVGRTRAKRTQFQVNFRTQMKDEPYRELVLAPALPLDR